MVGLADVAIQKLCQLDRQHQVDLQLQPALVASRVVDSVEVSEVVGEVVVVGDSEVGFVEVIGEDSAVEEEELATKVEVASEADEVDLVGLLMDLVMVQCLPLMPPRVLAVAEEVSVLVGIADPLSMVE